MAFNLREADAFLKTIREHPDDDTPRLVYADYLQENGQEERAELIRVQCRLGRPWTEDSGECWPCHCRRHRRQHTNGPCRCSPEFLNLREKEQTLIGNKGWDVEGHGFLRTFVREPHISYGSPAFVFIRGFVEFARMCTVEWLGLRELILAHRDVVLRTLSLTDWYNFDVFEIQKSDFQGHCPNHKVKLILDRRLVDLSEIALKA